MSFKFIEADATEYTAADATEEEELNVSGVFTQQDYYEAFRIGNTGSALADYDITTSGVNTTINDDVTYSIDEGENWETTATVSGVAPNEISERVRVKYTPDEGEYVGVGSFLIRVDER